MKLVVFAHTPPPFHGQSYVVQLMIEGFGGNYRQKPRHPSEKDQSRPVQCFHVNARFSRDLADIGSFRLRKFFLLLKYCLEAIWCRFRYGADTLYYVPSPPKRIAFYRDCMALCLCRPFFQRLVFHWEASGLAEWLEHDSFSWERWIARRLFRFADLSIALAEALSNDAAYFQSKRICVAPNGIPDPCPDFDESILRSREARLVRRREILKSKGAMNPERYRVVFLAHCTREKGLFDALGAIALANQQLAAENMTLRMHLTIAGAFLSQSERSEFESWQHAHRDQAHYAGFLAAGAKTKLLQESDCLCFPTYYSAEAQPIAIIEAMAFGLTIAASKWRGIPELLPKGYPFLISTRDAPKLASALIESMRLDFAKELRRHYCERFTAERYSRNLAEAFKRVCSGSR
jgi:glycosyltransferase involved in cell wall biosynthesis